RARSPQRVDDAIRSVVLAHPRAGAAPVVDEAVVARRVDVARARAPHGAQPPLGYVLVRPHAVALRVQKAAPRIVPRRGVAVARARAPDRVHRIELAAAAGLFAPRAVAGDVADAALHLGVRVPGLRRGGRGGAGVGTGAAEPTPRARGEREESD